MYNNDTRISFNDKGQLKNLSCGDKAFTKADAEWCGFNGKIGTANMYTANGKLERSEQYLNGKLNGLYKEYDTETGKVIKSIQYKDGASVGESKASAQGETLFKSNCDSTFTKCEETKYYEDTKTIESHVKWENKIKVFEQYNYQNGNQKKLSVYKDGKYLVTEFFDSGKKSLVTELATIAVGTLDSPESEIIKQGSQDSFDEDGNLTSHEQFDKGRRQGLSKFYSDIKGHKVIEERTYDKGQITSVKIIVDGKDIIIKEFMKDGSTKSSKRLNKSPIDEYIK